MDMLVNEARNQVTAFQIDRFHRNPSQGKAVPDSEDPPASHQHFLLRKRLRRINLRVLE